MNFSDSRKDNYTKKCQVRAFKVNTSTTDVLFDQVSNSSQFVVGTVIRLSNEKYLTLKDFSTSSDCHYLQFSTFNPKEQVSITPAQVGVNDLVDIENMDSLHAFLIIKKNNIASLMQISTNWCESKIAKIFENFGIRVTPSPILKKDVIARIKNDGFKALHVNIKVDETDFTNIPGCFSSIFKKEPEIRTKGITGHLTIDAKGNSELEKSVVNNTSTWIDELDSDFYLETKKGEKIKGDDLKVIKTYYTVPYGSKSINAKHAKEILENFVSSGLL
ncbi:hypothetical protein [Lonsdalea quercina]|uniref:hypothetical protein n=1 Tax=Lonsdalea quercina TaxID=71657 RepID=UPI0004797CAB|nr:hypothetical protein [Lonsdalea quercina]